MPSNSGSNVGTVGAHGPIKPFKFYLPPLAQAPPPTVIDDGSDGWDGFATTFGQTAVAIASALALAVSMTAAAQQTYLQDELPQQPAVTIVEEMYWNCPVLPVPPGGDWTVPVQNFDLDYSPRISVDEVYWSDTTPLNQQSASTQVTFYDQDPLPSIVDEVYCLNCALLPSPIWYAQPFIPDVDYVPPPAATIVDEIAWSPPAPFTIPGWDWYSQPSIGPDADYPPQIHVDEQYWINQVAPNSFGSDWTYQPPPIEDGYLPSISIEDQPWQNPVAAVPPQPNLQPPVIPDADYPPQIAVSDDVWINQVPPVAPPPNQAWPVIEQDQVPRIAVSDDFWQTSQQWPIAPPIQQPFDSDFLPHTATSVVDEIYWLSSFTSTTSAPLANFQQSPVIEEMWSPRSRTSFVVWLD